MSQFDLDKPIIDHPLVQDTYKATISRFAFTKDAYWGRPVRYRLINRTKSVRLADLVPLTILDPQMNAIRDLRFGEDDLSLISSVHPALAEPSYVDALRNVRLPDFHLGITDDGQLDLTVTGEWGQALWWEIPILALVTELYTRTAIGKDLGMCLARGVARMNNKINLLARHPNIKFLWFGTRRAASRDWERLCFETWLQALPDQVQSCSNLQLAKEFGVKPGGTQAHELPMVLAAIAGQNGNDEALYSSQNEFYDEWWRLFGGAVSIALPDTFGSNHFFQTFGEERALRWWGAREDSGDPFWWGDRYVQMLKSHGVNPIGKMALFSDGLDPWLMVKLAGYFDGRVDCGFGIGSNLTNDIGVKNLSLVMKVEAVMGDDGKWIPAVKLSDNPAKAIGDPEEIERYKRVFQYEPGKTVEPRY
jgi:nicotinate phosphoribosyltransferase